MKTPIICLFFFSLVACLDIQAQAVICSSTDSLGAATFFEKAQVSYKQNKLKDAAAFFEKARDAYQELGCFDQVYLMNRNALKIYLSMGSPGGFNALYNKIMSQTKDPVNSDEWVYKGRVMLLKSNLCLHEKKLDSAIVIGQRASKILEKEGALDYYITANSHLAVVSYYQQKFDNMETYIDNSFAAYKKLKKSDNRTLQEITEQYGALYYKTGNFEKALEKTLSALELATALLETDKDPSFVARCYNNIGLFYIELGDIYKAEDYCLNALNLYKKAGSYYEAATTNLNLGEFFARQGKYENALIYYKAGVNALSKAAGIPPHQMDKSSINMYNGIGDAAAKLGRFTEATEALQKSLDIHQREESKKDETYSVLGMKFRLMGEYEEALSYHSKVLAIRQKLYGEIHPLTAAAYFDFGLTQQKKNNPSEAKKYYDLTKLSLGIHAKANLTDFIKYNLVDISEKSILLQVLDGEARLLMEEGLVEKAYSTIQDAVLLLGKMRNSYKAEGSRLFMLQKMIPTYELAIELSLKLYQKKKDAAYLEEAFRFVENSKAMLLLDALKSEDARNFGNLPPDLLDEERRLARECARYEKSLLEAKRAAFEEDIVKSQNELLNIKIASEKLQQIIIDKYPKYYELKYNTETASLKDVQENLDSKTALIEYFVGNENIFIFSIYKDSVWVSTVPLSSNFVGAIRNLRSSLTDIQNLSKNAEPIYLSFAKNARTLFQKYLEPALKQTETAERLVLIPDGMFNYVPFDVLLFDKPDYKNVNFKQLPYLIKRYNINYHYSATLKLFSRKAINPNGKILGMAPSYDKDMFKNMKALKPNERKIRTSVGDLPGAKKEVEFLSQNFVGTFLYGEDVNEQSFKDLTQKSQFSVIHLAMHGVVDDKQPDYSNLVLTYTNSKDDDLLHAYELNLLEINTDLVVLSACETGYGKYERGEGVVSIGRGFMYSGAPSLVMTLWSINDRATSILISQFYNHLAEGYCKDEAMRMAKLSYLENASDLTSHPFFWASFINLGDYEPIYLSRHWAWWQLLLCGLPFLFIGVYIFNKKKRSEKS